MLRLYVGAALLLLPSLVNAAMVKNYAQVLNGQFKFRGLGTLLAQQNGYQFLIDSPEADLLDSDVQGQYAQVNFKKSESKKDSFQMVSMKSEAKLFDSKNNKFTYLLTSTTANGLSLQAVFFEKKRSNKKANSDKAKADSGQGAQFCSVDQGVVDFSSCLKLVESQLPGKEVVVELRDERDDEQDEVCARLVGSKKGFVWEISPGHFPIQRHAALAALVLGFSVLKNGQSPYLLPALAASALGVIVAGVQIFRANMKKGRHRACGSAEKLSRLVTDLVIGELRCFGFEPEEVLAQLENLAWLKPEKQDPKCVRWDLRWMNCLKSIEAEFGLPALRFSQAKVISPEVGFRTDVLVGLVLGLCHGYSREDLEAVVSSRLARIAWRFGEAKTPFVLMRSLPLAAGSSQGKGGPSRPAGGMQTACGAGSLTKAPGCLTKQASLPHSLQEVVRNYDPRGLNDGLADAEGKSGEGLRVHAGENGRRSCRAAKSDSGLASLVGLSKEQEDGLTVDNMLPGMIRDLEKPLLGTR
jgi:hypothetical protein